MPPEPARGAERLTSIPIDGALDCPDVVDLGLHLNHEKGSRTLMERQDVDPSARSIAPNLDFSFHQPAPTDEPARSVSGAARMDLVDRRARYLRLLRPDPVAHAERDEQSVDHRDAQVDEDTALDPRDSRLGHAGSSRQLVLTPPKADSDVVDRSTDVLQEAKPRAGWHATDVHQRPLSDGSSEPASVSASPAMRTAHGFRMNERIRTSRIDRNGRLWKSTLLIGVRLFGRCGLTRDFATGRR
jgi:hypothetical protein